MLSSRSDSPGRRLGTCEAPSGSGRRAAPSAIQIDDASPASEVQAVRFCSPRPRVRGKSGYLGNEKLYVCGVTYGAFQPDPAGNEYHDLAIVERDFASMAANGINAVRIPHTTPPR